MLKVHSIVFLKTFEKNQVKRITFMSINVNKLWLEKLKWSYQVAINLPS